jgi:hypothetical protein
MCGVRLERRKVERRVQQTSASTKCPSCGHINEQGYKFCAMCGARFDRRVSERRAGLSEQPRATAVANAQLPSPEGPVVATAEAGPAPDQERAMDEHFTSQPAAQVFHGTPARRSTSIGGPSFLGLSDDAENRADYLLEDEASSVGVLRKLVLVAVLAAVGGLIFMQWRSGFPILQSTRRSGDSATTKPLSPPEQSQSSSPGTQETAANAGADVTKDSSVAPSAASAAKDRVPDLLPPEKVSPSSTRPAEATAARNEGVPESVPSRDKSKVAKDDQDKPSLMLLRAQQYLQGTGGLPQNCDQGLVYLRAAAKSEAAAAVEMGALYASGHCVQLDRVAAYRWFNSAHELQPGNARIQASLNQLWAQMTPQERSQIVR